MFRKPTALTMLRFYSYRINLLTQNNLFAGIEPKETTFQKVIDDLREKNKDTFIARNSKFILFFYKELMPNVYALELAREETFKIPIEGETKIEEIPVVNTPFVYVIVDTKRQIILMQEKTSVFQDVEVSVARLKLYFENKLIPNFITPAIQPITDNTQFWDEIKGADITEFDITLEAPNLFKGRQKAEDLVEEIHEEFNITEVEIKLRNKLGKLKLLYENAKNFVSLAASGAGKYVLRGFKNGKELIIKSYQYIKKKTYDVEDPEQINRGELESDLKELDKLNEDNK